MSRTCPAGICTGTPICNSPRDAAGQMYAVCAGSPLDSEKEWLEKGVKGTVSTRTAALYRETQHRVTEEVLKRPPRRGRHDTSVPRPCPAPQVLKLPPMHRVVRHFHIRLRPADASEYMGEWEVMRRLRVQMNADARGRGALLLLLLLAPLWSTTAHC